MHVCCPQCDTPIRIVDGSSFKDIFCSTCSSSFNLVLEETIAISKVEPSRLVSPPRAEGSVDATLPLGDQLAIGGKPRQFGTTNSSKRSRAVVWASYTKLDNSASIASLL